VADGVQRATVILMVYSAEAFPSLNGDEMRLDILYSGGTPLQAFR
jgi:hypothetical protein